MAKKNYEDYIYIKGGTLMIQVKETVFEKDEKNDVLMEVEKLVFREYDKVTKDDIYAAIETFLEANPEQLSISIIIFSSIQLLTGIPKCNHCKTPPSDPNKKIQLNDPLYDELEKFTRNSKTYQNNFQKEQEKRKKKQQRKNEAIKKGYVSRQLDKFFIDGKRGNYLRNH